ncbi:MULTISPECIES: hypothetical protein [unclassified Streptomyces]|uniref:hypothetical protein n=1 Tax=unclassified Streptomyces TaxID=2593676 RepID=UPI00236586A5|nr:MULTISPECIES: hypothetical protein [unclassified Streptomyces]MDF3144161.1 hypothetical protein [Streptomyces sp. T21Q-yed]WDF45086.1 hypothetical protein PBV52_51215 [Streptomyces sp. T12]
MKEIRIEVDDETYEQLQRLAAGAEPGQYAKQLLTADLARAQFLDAARSFAGEHGPAFAEHFGAGPSSHAA